MLSIRLKASALLCTVSFLAGALALLAQGPPNGTGGPEVLARPRALVFHMAEGGDNPEPRTLTVFSPRGGEEFEWTATPMGTWLDIDPTSGTGPGTITVTVDGEGLSAGQHDGSITVTSGDTSVEVRVRLLVRPPAPANLVIHPRAFNFIMHPDGPPPAPKDTAREERRAGGAGLDSRSLHKRRRLAFN